MRPWLDLKPLLQAKPSPLLPTLIPIQYNKHTNLMEAAIIRYPQVFIILVVPLSHLFVSFDALLASQDQLGHKPSQGQLKRELDISHGKSYLAVTSACGPK